MCTATYVNVSNEVFQIKETVYGITTAIQLGTEDDESHKIMGNSNPNRQRRSSLYKKQRPICNNDHLSVLFVNISLNAP